jgi:adenylosuccinate lyase
MVQQHAMRAWKEDLNFHDLVLKDTEMTRRVPRQQIEYAFDLKRQLRNIDGIFARVFNHDGTGPRPSRKRKH